MTLVSYFKCPGITYITNDTNIYCHVIPLNSDISEGSSDDEEIKALVPYNRYQFMRNVKCWMLLPVEGEFLLNFVFPCGKNTKSFTKSDKIIRYELVEFETFYGGDLGYYTYFFIIFIFILRRAVIFL